MADKPTEQQIKSDNAYAWSAPLWTALSKKGFKDNEIVNMIYNIMAESGGKLVEEKGNKSMYRGRGYVQLTGKKNYEYFGKKLGIDLVNHPELANDPQYAPIIAAEFFHENKAWSHIKNYDTPQNVIMALKPATFLENSSTLSAQERANNAWNKRQEFLNTQKIRIPSLTDRPADLVKPAPAPAKVQNVKKVAMEDHPEFNNLRDMYRQKQISLGTFYERLQSNPQDEQLS
jgi:hypothetical protein